MSLFSKKKTQSTKNTVCQHDEVDPRWDAMADAGIKDRIDHYICRRCAVRLEKPLPASGD